MYFPHISRETNHMLEAKFPVKAKPDRVIMESSTPISSTAADCFETLASHAGIPKHHAEFMLLMVC